MGALAAKWLAAILGRAFRAGSSGNRITTRNLLNMADSSLDVVGIGNAIVDVLS